MQVPVSDLAMNHKPEDTMNELIRDLLISAAVTALLSLFACTPSVGVTSAALTCAACDGALPACGGACGGVTCASDEQCISDSPNCTPPDCGNCISLCRDQFDFSVPVDLSTPPDLTTAPDLTPPSYQGTCAHDPALPGVALDPSCDPRVAHACSLSSGFGGDCCSGEPYARWSLPCIGAVGLGGPLHAPDSGKCEHDYCQTGGPLSSSCDGQYGCVWFVQLLSPYLEWPCAAGQPWTQACVDATYWCGSAYWCEPSTVEQ